MDELKAAQRFAQYFEDLVRLELVFDKEWVKQIFMSGYRTGVTDGWAEATTTKSSPDPEVA